MQALAKDLRDSGTLRSLADSLGSPLGGGGAAPGTGPGHGGVAAD
jgi:hypothetical protein